jgi:hypothetical protein
MARARCVSLIADSRKALKAFYEAKGLTVDTSENASRFSDTGLARYKAVVFLKNTGDFLNDAQQTAFEKWFRSGNGAQIIHAALDTEMSWAFYGKINGGAYFQSLPGDSNTVHAIIVEGSLDPSPRAMPKPWQRKDETYGFRANPTTAIGYVTPAYTAQMDSVFLYHLWGGMEYLLKREVGPIAFPTAKRKTAGSALKAIFPSGARFGDRLENDARGRENRGNGERNAGNINRCHWEWSSRVPFPRKGQKEPDLGDKGIGLGEKSSDIVQPSRPTFPLVFP